MKLNVKKNFNGRIHKAESPNGRFVWSMHSPSELLDTQKGRLICQMAWLKKTEFGSDPVDKDTASKVNEFFSDLKIAEKELQAEYLSSLEPDPDPDPGAQAPCHKCGSYCYGDCDIH